MMNHDISHCLDYKKSYCPKSCFRAQATEELRHIKYLLPTTWSHCKGTPLCPLGEKKEAKNETQTETLS